MGYDVRHDVPVRLVKGHADGDLRLYLWIFLTSGILEWLSMKIAPSSLTFWAICVPCVLITKRPTYGT
jgi:hypothetical protein